MIFQAGKNLTEWATLAFQGAVLLVILSGCVKGNGPGQTKQNFSAETGSTGQSDTSFLSSQVKPRPVKPIEEMTKAEREAYRKELHEAGFYVCCTDPECTMCLYDDEECYCGTAAKNGDPVCGECYRGWQKGKGSLKGIKPEKIRRN